MTVIVVVAVLAVLGMLLVADRFAARRKEEARELLRREVARVEARDIMDLVHEEAAVLGIEAIPGGDGVPLVVRLKVWRRDVATGTDPSRLRFVVEGDPAAATEEQVRLEPGDPTEGGPAT
jgi:hypothetical protein